jgi:hypothetical protein
MMTRVKHGYIELNISSIESNITVTTILIFRLSKIYKLQHCKVSLVFSQRIPGRKLREKTSIQTTGRKAIRISNVSLLVK